MPNSAGSCGETQSQRDIYFDTPERSFLAAPESSEWLRLRFQGDTVSLKYKLWHPLDAIVKTHCDEYETLVSNGEAMRLTLEALGYRELVVVSKRCEEWEFGDALVAMDEVEGLGSFIELEYMGSGLTVAEAHARIAATVALLDIELGASTPAVDRYVHGWAASWRW